MNLKSLAGAVFLSCLILPVFPLDFTTEIRSGAADSSKDILLFDAEATFTHTGGNFFFITGMSLDNEPLYTASIFNEFGNLNINIEQAGIVFAAEPVTIAFGKLAKGDVVESPYSLFLNGMPESLLSFDFSYEDELFLYRERWMELNQKSRYSWPDRSAVFKAYGLKIGNLRFGFEDIAVSGSSLFDPKDVLIPIPSVLIQYVASASGRPWSETENKNSIMGFFGEYQGDTWYAYAQLLIDDINLNRFIKPDGFQNPDKIAFSLGGTKTFGSIGEFGFYVAGATKYTFEAYGSPGNNTMYGYSRWPANAFYYEGAWQPIPVSQNSVGYVNGENDLSLLATWSLIPWAGTGVFGKLSLDSALKFSITGSQSPGNPWHELDKCEEGSHYLDDPVLRKRLSLSSKAALPIGPIVLILNGSFGFELNRMELDTSPPTSDSDPINGQPIFRPGSTSGLIGSLDMTLAYTYKF